MQIYKVFIDNSPVFFEINSKSSEVFLTIDEIKQGLIDFENSDFTDLYIEIESEAVFFEIFSDYKFIEAAGGLVESKKKYLFIKRNGYWDIPKGKLEKGETVEEAAVREIVEECGFKTAPKLVKHLIDTWHVYIQNDVKYLKKTYWYLLNYKGDIKKLTPQLEEGITELTFLPKKAFDRIKNNTFKSIKDVLKTLN